MIRAVFERKNGRLCGFRMSGHAGYADAGQDIVCAAVTSAVQYATIMITEQFREPCQEQADEQGDENLVTVRLTSPEKGQAAAVLEGLCMHLSILSEDFPGMIAIKIRQI